MRNILQRSYSRYLTDYQDSCGLIKEVGQRPISTRKGPGLLTLCDLSVICILVPLLPLILAGFQEEMAKCRKTLRRLPPRLFKDRQMCAAEQVTDLKQEQQREVRHQGNLDIRTLIAEGPNPSTNSTS